MDFLSKATDNQLKVIVSGDNDCPTSLLCGVVTEMLNRNLFDALIHKAIRSRFRNRDIAVNVLKISEEEIYQCCRLEIFETVKRYKQGISNFIYYSYRSLLSFLRDIEKKVKAEKRKVYEHIQSTDKLLNEEGETYIQTIRSHINVEVYVIRKITLEEKLKPLTEEERETFLYYLKGLSFGEIAKLIGISKSGVDRRINRALEKVFGRKVKLKDLGIRNDVGRVLA